MLTFWNHTLTNLFPIRCTKQLDLFTEIVEYHLHCGIDPRTAFWDRVVYTICALEKVEVGDSRDAEP